MKKLHASGEDYLEAVLVLQKERGMVRSVDVARYMGVSKPSVCHAVATLKEGGFLSMDEDFFLRLTNVGREVAEQTYEKHCFFTRLLVDAEMCIRDSLCGGAGPGGRLHRPRPGMAGAGASAGQHSGPGGPQPLQPAPADPRRLTDGNTGRSEKCGESCQFDT